MQKQPEPTVTKQAYSIREAATILGVHEWTVRERISEGHLEAFKFGGVWRIPKAALDSLLGVAS